MKSITKAFLTKLVKDPKKELDVMSEDDVAQLVQHLNHVYHTKGQSAVPDNTYELIKDRLKSLNKKHPLLKNIGAAIDDKDKRKVKLPVFMGSMDKNKRDTSALDSFKLKHGPKYVVSDKLDGVSGLFYYQANKQHVSLYTRGDGTYGQNVSHLIPLINGLADIDTIHFKNNLLVRGEFIISRENFEKIKDQGANARNMVAGLVNAKKPDLKLLKYVEFRAYALIDETLSVDDQFRLLIDKGFKIPFFKVLKEADLNIENLSTILIDRRKNSPFEVDGIIVSDNAPHKVASKGNPLYAFAFKDILTNETAEVTVTNVIWNLSKDGLFKPIVEITPVHLNGVVIRKATGFNGDFIESNVIGPGAKIVITRSGDVIPYIVKVLSPADSGNAQMPSEPYEWNDTHKEIKIKGESEALDFKQIENFFDKVGIKGVAAKSVKKLYDAGLTSIKAVVLAKDKDFVAIQGLLNKATFHQRLHARLQELDCLTLMIASNAFGHGFGERRLALILDNFPSIITSKTFVPSLKELENVQGVSTVTAKAFIVGLKAYRDFINEVKLSCSSPTSQKKPVIEKKPNGKSSPTSLKQKFAGQIIVFTGFRNKEWENRIKEQGGVVGTSVSGKTTMIVVKDLTSTSSKVKEAKARGIKIMDVEGFEKLL